MPGAVHVALLVAAAALPVAAALGVRGAAGRTIDAERGSATTQPLRPNPYVLWVQNGIVPTTTPPAYEQCFGCGCLIPFPERFVSHGILDARYGCAASPDAAPMPEIRWIPPTEGPQCTACQTFALTVADLDYPYGAGSQQNTVHSMFWVVNIPSDWTEFSEAKLAEARADAGGALPVVVGRNSRGVAGLEPLCPEEGRHRYRLTLWALRCDLPGVSASTPYSEVARRLEENELARATIFIQVSAKPTANASSAALLQRGIRRPAGA